MTLYEFFNTTNQTSPYCQRHESFVKDLKEPTCAMVTSLPPEERCEFVKMTEQCNNDVFMFNYIQLFYCVINPTNTVSMVASFLLLLCICGYLFLILGSTADKFFCPSLKVLAMMLGLNENVAGVTLLAFGNSSPDVFTTFAGLQSVSRRLYSDVFSGAIFVNFFIAGSIVTTMPFVLQPATSTRDILFLLLGTLFIDYAIKSDNHVTVIEAVLIIAIYFTYITIVILDQYLLKRITKDIDEAISAGAEIDYNQQKRSSSLHSQADFEIFSKNARKQSRSYTITSLRTMPSGSLRADRDVPIVMLPFVYFGSNYCLWGQFMHALNPIDVDQWRAGGLLTHTFQIMKMPVLMLLNLLIPVVDFELKDHGWSKLMNCINIVILPCVVCYGTVGMSSIFYIPIIIILINITIPVAIFVFNVTRTDTIPTYHEYLSILGIVGSIFVIYGCAAEAVNILDVIGITASRSSSFLGCSLLAWGNSIGDLISDMTLARQGYQKMAFASCFGGPLLNILFVIGSALLYKTLNSPKRAIHESEGTLGENCSIFLTIGLSGLLLASTTTNSVMRRGIGIYMLTIYLLFLLTVVLGEMEITHPYGTEHRLDIRPEEFI